jgi:deoxycytidylate deaminase
MSQITYPFIPKDRTILYVGPDNEFMKAAEAACKELSTDRYHPTGAVLVKDGKIIARAANQSALKNEKLLELHRKGFCVRKLFKIPSGQKYWLCPGCSSSKNHAETSVVRDARKRGISTEGSDLYLWGHWWCCEPCWNSIISGGIRDVYLLEGSDRLFNPKFPENIIGK